MASGSLSLRSNRVPSRLPDRRPTTGLPRTSRRRRRPGGRAGGRRESILLPSGRFEAVGGSDRVICRSVSLLFVAVEVCVLRVRPRPNEQLSEERVAVLLGLAVLLAFVL